MSITHYNTHMYVCICVFGLRTYYVNHLMCNNSYLHELDTGV